MEVTDGTVMIGERPCESYFYSEALLLLGTQELSLFEKFLEDITSGMAVIQKLGAPPNVFLIATLFSKFH